MERFFTSFVVLILSSGAVSSVWAQAAGSKYPDLVEWQRLFKQLGIKPE